MKNDLARIRAARWAWLVAATLPAAALAADPPGMKGAQAQFHAMDTDGDGKLSAAEHAAGARKMFERMDLDRDGQVAPAEMDKAHRQLARQAGANRRNDLSSADKIKAIDGDGDGRLSAKEHADGSRAMFDTMDLDRDGVLVPSELAAGHAKLLHRGTE
jgi:hypothetical protein